MCPTCGHTVQRVNEGINPVTFWCPRCGTLKTDGVPDHEQPRLTRKIIAATSDREVMQEVVHFLGGLPEQK